MKKEKSDSVAIRGKTAVSIEEYRQLMNDHQSTDKRIIERVQFIESLCRNVIRIELEKLRNQTTVLGGNISELPTPAPVSRLPRAPDGQ